MIYQFTGVTDELLGNDVHNQQETASLFKARNASAIRRINSILERCNVGIQVLASQFLDLLTLPNLHFRKMANPHIIKRLISSDLDPSEQLYEWVGLSQSSLIGPKQYYDTISEINNISIAKMVEGGFLDPRLIIKHLPFISQKEIDNLAEQDQKAANDKNQLAAQSEMNQNQLRLLEVEERKATNAEKMLTERLKILGDVMSQEGVDSTTKSKSREKFLQLLDQITSKK